MQSEITLEQFCCTAFFASLELFSCLSRSMAEAKISQGQTLIFKVIKAWDPWDPRLLSPQHEGPEHGAGSGRGCRRVCGRAPAVRVCPEGRSGGQQQRPLRQTAPGRKVTAPSHGIKLEGRSNFLPTLQSKQSASTDSTMGPLKPESDNGRGGSTIQLKTKADSSQNSLPEALQTEGKNKRVKIDSTLIHSNCTTGIIGISEVEIVKRQDFRN